MYPHLRRTTRRYAAALRLNPPVGYVDGWPAQLPPAGGLQGVDGFWDDLKNAAVGPVNASIADQASQLKSTLKLITGLSAVAAVTGLISLIRHR